MSLRPLRQTEQVNIDYISPWTQERGGCLSYATASGITFAQYAHDPVDVIPIGVQLNDIEWMNLARQYHRQYRNGTLTDLPCGIVGIGTQGDFITDWVHLIGDVFPGDVMYVGPSGTFTNDSSFGSNIIGKFIGVLDPDPHELVMRGLGFSRVFIDTNTKKQVTENSEADRTLVQSPGYIKIRVDIGKRLK